MTGTSLDALDACLVRIVNRGPAMQAFLAGHQSHSLASLREALLTLASDQPQTALVYMRTARRFGEMHAHAIQQLCRTFLPEQAALSLIAAHGQTICHRSGERLSWQLLDPWPITRQLGTPVVYDLRQADLVADGEGAPITPMADWLLFRDAGRSRAVVNLGGVCNMTLLPAGTGCEHVAAGDVGPCNLLLDGLARHLFNEPYDADGRRAASGHVRRALVEEIDRHISAAMDEARTLGREQFSDRWITRLISACKREESEGGDVDRSDLLASAVEAVARRIAADARLRGVEEVIVAGGGAKHPGLVQALSRHLPRTSVTRSEALGVPVDAREALAMAVLGALCHDGVAITLPQVTGATAPGVAGTWAGLPRGV